MISPQRSLRPRENRPGICFCSNDYLGLSAHPAVKRAAIETIDQEGVGATGSRLLSGDHSLFHTLEYKLAAWKHKATSLVFNGGYPMNVSLIASVLGPQDVIFADRYSHASIIDGARLSGAKLFRFSHNNLTHLETLLQRHRHTYSKALIVTESVFSMEGDRADIETLIKLKRCYNTLLMVDEAHALGVLGPKGEGLVSAALAPDVDWIVGTLGKALGSVGGFVACDAIWKQLWINSARGLIYSTAIPPAAVAAAIQALDIIKTTGCPADFWPKVAHFRLGLLRLPYPILGDTHIVPILMPSEDTTVRCSHFLAQLGMDAPSILKPTVPAHHTRIRISVCTWHRADQLADLSEALYRFSTHSLS